MFVVAGRPEMFIVGFSNGLPALESKSARTVAGDEPAFRDRYNATVPATCGDAIDVPLNVLVVVPLYVESTLTPGARMST